MGGAIILRGIIMQGVLYNQKTIILSIGCGHQIPLRIYISDTVPESRKNLRVTMSVGYYLSQTSSDDMPEEYLAREHKLMTPVLRPLDNG